jgi:hypothetical protein
MNTPEKPRRQSDPIVEILVALTRGRVDLRSSGVDIVRYLLAISALIASIAGLVAALRGN